ncbi:MAG: GatB/YqeY domain-containing protein [Melioribacteraceae bacterium]|nr:GatB/YqeY domain-containing protein [Melioribacteraceae bacterium]
MNLKDKINADLKDAMKSQDKVRLNTVRSIRALILEYEKSGSEKELSPEDEIKLLSSAAKKRKDAVEQYSNAGRQELADNELKELEIIQSYLPAQLSDEEIIDKIKIIASDVGASAKADFGKLMGAAMKELKGKADGNKIRETVEKILS